MPPLQREADDPRRSPGGADGRRDETTRLRATYGAQRPCEMVGNCLGDGAGPKAPTLIEHLQSTADDVREGLARLCQSLAALGVARDDVISVELVLAEAMNNIVEHAYENEARGWIALEADYLDGWVICRLTDGGRAMPGGALPPARRHDLTVGLDKLPEGGFGWPMIHDLTHHLEYRRLPGANCLCLALRLSSAS